MLEFYPNINLTATMLPEHGGLNGPDCNGRAGKSLTMRGLMESFNDSLCETRKRFRLSDPDEMSKFPTAKRKTRFSH